MFPNGVKTGASLTAPQSTEQVKYQIRDDFSWRVAGFGGLGHELQGRRELHQRAAAVHREYDRPKASSPTRCSPTTRLGPCRRITQNDGAASANIPTKQYGFYLQDDWRVSDRLTVNAGIRYDLVTGLIFDQSQNPNFVKVQAAARAGDLDGIVGLENFGLDPQSDRNNIQPRIGAVYDVERHGQEISSAAVGASTPISAIRTRTC